MADSATRLKMEFEANVSEAEDFSVALAIGLAGTVVPADPPVPVALPPDEPALVVLNSWNRTCGALEGIAAGEMVLVVDRTEIVCELSSLELDELEDVEVEELLELLDEVQLGVHVDVGVGVGIGVVVGMGDGSDEAAMDPEPEAEESPAGKTTTLADPPSGTVTTQKFAPPAPDAWSELVTPPIPLVEGSMEQGRPLQPEPEHSTLRPKVGSVPLSGEPVQIGFQPILKKVFPFESVFPPTTYGAQFPMGWDPSPQTQPSSVLTPGGLT